MEKVLVIFKEDECKEHTVAVSNIITLLNKEKICYKAICRSTLHSTDIKQIDLIIVVGGDGTFLRASHYAADIPMLGINSNPQKTEGFFMHYTPKNIEKCLKRIKKRKEKLFGLTRLQATINGNPTVPCLNEYFIGHKKSYGVAQYTLRIPSGKEQQKSSGVLISTAAGSHAWTKSAAGDVLELNDNRFQFLVREPYNGRLSKPTLIRGIINPQQYVVVTAMRDDMILISDSVSEEYAIRTGDVIKITTCKYPCWLVE